MDGNKKNAHKVTEIYDRVDFEKKESLGISRKDQTDWRFGDVENRSGSLEEC